MGAASLFGKLLKEGAEYADNILDVGRAQTKVQTGANVKWRTDLFDPRAYEEANPNPVKHIKQKDRTREQINEYQKWNNGMKSASYRHNMKILESLVGKDEATRIARDSGSSAVVRSGRVKKAVEKALGWDEDAWSAASGGFKPGDKEYPTFNAARSKAREEALDGLEVRTFDPSEIGTSKYASRKNVFEGTPEWEAPMYGPDNPAPDGNELYFDAGSFAGPKNDLQRARGDHAEMILRRFFGEDAAKFWDEDAWRKVNPKPEDITNQAYRERRERARARSFRQALDHHLGWDEDAWVAANPRPEGLKERNAWGQARKQAARDGRSGNVPITFDEWHHKNVTSRPAVRRGRTRDELKEKKERDKFDRSLRNMPWSNRESLFDIQQFSRDLSKETGIEMHMDHTRPLRGDYVSGLNLPNNIKVYPKDWNLEKGADYDPGSESLFPSDLFGQNNYTDHKAFLDANAASIARRTKAKKQKVAGVSDQLDQEIFNPNTKVGSNARSLWGVDQERMLTALRNIQRQRLGRSLLYMEPTK